MDEKTANEQCMLALKYASGNGATLDPVFAVKLFEEVASEGYPNGQFGLAELLITGNGVQQNIPRAMEYYSKAAAQEHPAAMFRLASMMIEDGPNQNIEKAKNYFIRCAELGMAMAFIVAGDINFYGIGGEPDMNIAFEWYHQAALAEDPIAMFKCGYMLENGVGTTPNKSESIMMFEHSALRGVPEAQFKMAGLAYDGKIPGGKAECVKWYEKCAAQGYPAAVFNLATLYYDGDGIDRDVKKAFSLYKQVAEETNDGDSYFILGRMYLEGIGTKQNMEKGLECIGKAATAGNTMAQQLTENMKRRQNTQMIKIDGTE